MSARTTESSPSLWCGALTAWLVPLEFFHGRVLTLGRNLLCSTSGQIELSGILSIRLSQRRAVARARINERLAALLAPQPIIIDSHDVRRVMHEPQWGQGSTSASGCCSGSSSPSQCRKSAASSAVSTIRWRKLPRHGRRTKIQTSCLPQPLLPRFHAYLISARQTCPIRS
jgi:hypothetical protein